MLEIALAIRFTTPDIFFIPYYFPFFPGKSAQLKVLFTFILMVIVLIQTILPNYYYNLPVAFIFLYLFILGNFQFLAFWLSSVYCLCFALEDVLESSFGAVNITSFFRYMSEQVYNQGCPI